MLIRRINNMQNQLQDQAGLVYTTFTNVIDDELPANPYLSLTS
ncbi:hypothetical protein SP41_23 [Salmonella phage 41]|nr:hypothetical protein SP41_23 [Salmonella phage 41]